jgi:hypothetical protein
MKKNGGVGVLFCTSPFYLFWALGNCAWTPPSHVNITNVFTMEWQTIPLQLNMPKITEGIPR